MLEKLKYGGFVLGICFPIAALLLDLTLKDLSLDISSILLLHRLNPLHWIIDLAPIVLGVGCFFAATGISNQISL